MRRFFGIVFLFLVGCASAKQGGFLNSYADLTSGEYLEKISISSELKDKKNLPVQVEEPKLLDLSTNEAFPGEEGRKFLKNALEVQLRNVSGMQIATGAQGPALKLETAITKWNQGSRAMRWFAGELGAGHSHVQVEGRLVDPASGNVIFQFADRRAGSASGGLDITGGDPREMMTTDLDNIAKSVAETLRDLR